MPKLVKDVFNACVNQSSKLYDAVVGEIKFSKKLNAVILECTSKENIPLFEIEEFEKKACEMYELKSFQVDYKYIGIISKLEISNILEIISDVSRRYDYTKNVFDGCRVVIDEDIKNISIFLYKPFASFLHIKKIDEYIKKSIFTQYGIKYDIIIKEDESIKNVAPEKIKMVKLENIFSSTDFEGRETPKENAAKSGNNNFNSQQKYPMRPALTEEEKADRERAKQEQPAHVIYGVDILTDARIKVADVNQNMERVCIDGYIFAKDVRETKNGKFIVALDVTDNSSTICCKMFLDKKKYELLNGKLNKGDYVQVQGRPQIDPYAKELGIMISNIIEGKKPEAKKDNAEEKRVELHMHTQMSAMDGVSSASDIVKQAIKWGHRAVAITDHGVAQAFPEAHQAIMKAFTSLVKKEKGYPTTTEVLEIAPTKVIYGIEGYLTQDVEPNPKMSDTFCVFDLETTGFNPKFDKITEIAVVKVKNGELIDEFTTFVNPERSIPENVQELTHITEEMVADAPTIKEVLPKFLEFVGDSILVAHNARFDISFILHYAKELDLKVENNVIDTLTMARELYETFENHKLGTIAENLGIELEGAHRAINDTRATAKVFLKMQEDAKAKGIGEYGYMYSVIDEDAKKLPYYHIIILTKDYVGLKNLYKLISFSHITYFNKRPRIPRSLLNRYRQGLIIGSACERGELYQAVFNKQSQEEIESTAKYYDYLEIQPLGNNQFYIDQGKVSSEQDLIDVNKSIIKLGEKLNIPVVATTDAHFLNPEDEIYRRIIMAGQGFSDADKQAPLYFRTTDEMKAEFKYLDDAKIQEIVVTNPNKIADMCQAIQPVVDGTYPPSIEGSEEMIRDISYTTARSIYGENLPEIVEQRLEKELVPIIKYGFAVMYIIAMKLVKKSNADGYLVGSRGSVGSSFVATMTGITEVNPLPPHYICPNCKFSEFPHTTVTCGVDMEDKDCPKCGTKFKKNGMDIPFETFLGFKGDKAPDIDLNFSGDNQASAHAYTEVLFGKAKTFRAGTIGTVADKTAYGFVKKYLDERGKSMPLPEINRISQGCTGIKRTTGQHPGGIIVVPRDKEIYDFCPIQKPADDPTSRSVTTHFDFHSIHDNLLKLDILGHDDPTVIRMLEDLTGIDAKTIPLDEPKVMSLFAGTEALGVTKEQINSETGTYAVPEFGTKFVRGMLLDTRPTSFGELVRISGLSHGTDVWLGNAQTLIEDGTATLNQTICTRDDIMLYLIQMGVDPQISFKTMESVRKGKGLTEEMEAAMREKDVPDWYIASCKKIKYMFPKAHAAAYVMMAYRIAYFKVYYPKEFYATYMSVRASVINYEMMMHGKDVVKRSIKELEQKQDATNTDKDTITVLEVVNEMYERKINFLPVDIYKSDAKKFLVEEDGIRPPLSALTGFGEVDALKLVEVRKEGKFSSIEVMAAKAKLGKVAVETLQKAGCLDGMPRSEQLDMFDLL